MDSLGSFIGNKISNFSDEGYETFLKSNRAWRKAANKDRKYEGALRKGNTKEAEIKAKSVDSYDKIGDSHYNSEFIKGLRLRSDDNFKSLYLTNPTIDKEWDRYGEYTSGLAKSGKNLKKVSGSPRSSKSAAYSLDRISDLGFKAGLSDSKIAGSLMKIYTKTKTMPQLS